MQFILFSVFALTSCTPTSARNHNIAVAQTGNQFTPLVLKNIPSNLTLTFYFYPQNFSIVSSTFAEPCAPRPGALFSGFHTTNGSIAQSKFMVIINNTAPMWIYGVDGGDLANGDGASKCRAGMSLVVNPAKDETLKLYRGKHGGRSEVPLDIAGGVVKQVREKERVRWLAKHPVGTQGVHMDGVQEFVSGAGAASAGTMGLVILGMLW